MSEPWLAIRRKNITDWNILCDFLKLEPPFRKKILKNSPFLLNLPLHLAKKIKKNSLDDPLLMQFVPIDEEEMNKKGFVTDPLSEKAFRKAPKLLSKYQGRSLLLTTPACGMHCRYCFRRHFTFENKNTSFDEELRLIANNPTLIEVILSGGDPLSLTNSQLSSLISSLEEIPHLKRLRFHTRLPLGIPERIDERFLEIVKTERLQTIFILHCNHPLELDTTVLASLKRLQCLRIPLLNQAVLLKGINDDFETLKTLCEKLSDHGIFPYYLHQLDKVEGAAHFYVPEKKGKELMKSLLEHLPGYAVPRYVREIPGKPHKTIIA